MNKNEKYIVPEVLHTALRILYTRDARESAKNREGYGFPFKNESMPNSDLRAWFRGNTRSVDTRRLPGNHPRGCIVIWIIVKSCLPLVTKMSLTDSTPTSVCVWQRWDRQREDMVCVNEGEGIAQVNWMMMSSLDSVCVPNADAKWNDW